MSTNLLNLDALRTERTVILNQKERALRSMTVKQFIASFEGEKTFDAADEATKFKLLVDEIPKFMADTTTEELQNLELIQLTALFAFIRGTDKAAETGVKLVKEPAVEGNAVSPTP